MNNIIDIILNDIQDNYKKTIDTGQTILKKYIQENPEQYKPEHQHLFTKEELENLCQSLR
jgi:hypothetical protein